MYRARCENYTRAEHDYETATMHDDLVMGDPGIEYAYPTLQGLISRMKSMLEVDEVYLTGDIIECKRLEDEYTNKVTNQMQGVKRMYVATYTFRVVHERKVNIVDEYLKEAEFE